MENNKDENSMVTSDSAEVMDLLIGLISDSTNGDKVALNQSYSIIEKYLEILNLLRQSPDEIKKIKRKLLPSRRVNQLNAEDFANGANSLKKGESYLIDDKEKEM